MIWPVEAFRRRPQPSFDEVMREEGFCTVRYGADAKGSIEGEIYLITTFDNGRTNFAWIPALQCFKVAYLGYTPFYQDVKP